MIRLTVCELVEFIGTAGRGTPSLGRLTPGHSVLNYSLFLLEKKLCCCELLLTVVTIVIVFWGAILAVTSTFVEIRGFYDR